MRHEANSSDNSSAILGRPARARVIFRRGPLDSHEVEGELGRLETECEPERRMRLDGWRERERDRS